MHISNDFLHPFAETVVIDYIGSVFYYDFTKDFRFDGESHDYWEFVYVDSGEIIATAENQDFFLKKGEIIFHKPNEFHKLRCNGINAPNVVVISFYSESEALHFFDGKRLKVPDEYRWIMSKIIEEAKNAFEKNTVIPLKNQKIGAEQLIKNYLESFLLYLMRDDGTRVFFSEKNISESHLVGTMINIMEEYLYSKLDLSLLCEKLGYSTTYLCTLFKAQTNTGIMHYYMQLKIKEAKRLLREKEYNITQIAELLCFNNAHYFSHVFSKYTGISPRDYINSVNKVESAL